jgi:hypothetical protein
MALFPETMKMNGGGAMTLESIAAKLTYFENQIHLIHWETTSHAEHSALNFYDDIGSFKDDVMEKLMGYMGRRPSGFKIDPILPGQDSTQLVSEVKDWSYALYEWAGENHYCDVENMAQELSGKAAKTLYLLTQS